MDCPGADPLVAACPLDAGMGGALRLGAPEDFAPACGTAGAANATPAACPEPWCGRDAVPACGSSVVCEVPAPTPKRPPSRRCAGGNTALASALTAAGCKAPRFGATRAPGTPSTAA